MNDTRELTDEQCDEFRRTFGSFNDMVRTIYAAGRASMAKVPAGLASIEFAPKDGTDVFLYDAVTDTGPTVCYFDDQWRDTWGGGSYGSATHFKHVDKPLLSTLPKDEPSSHWKLGMRVMQSELYRSLDCEERAICDELIAQNPYMAKRPKDDTQASLAVAVHAYGGTTGINDYLMADGTIKAMRPDDVVWATQPVAPQADIGVEGQDASKYTFDEIQNAWEESGVIGDWLEFVTNLGARSST